MSHTVHRANGREFKAISIPVRFALTVSRRKQLRLNSPFQFSSSFLGERCRQNSRRVQTVQHSIGHGLTKIGRLAGARTGANEFK